jgi:predicted Zn-ribbon and HTH transcriptional regulator
MIGAEYRCTRSLCRHQWYSRTLEPPKSCPKCKKYKIEAIEREQ